MTIVGTSTVPLPSARPLVALLVVCIALGGCYRHKYLAHTATYAGESGQTTKACIKKCSPARLASDADYEGCVLECPGFRRHEMTCQELEHEFDVCVHEEVRDGLWPAATTLAVMLAIAAPLLLLVAGAGCVSPKCG